MASVPPDLTLTPLEGAPRTASEQLSLFQLAAVVLDPYTHESAWLLDTAARILQHFGGADCRTAWIVTAGPDDARAFLGPWAERVLTFADADRTFVKAIGLESLPAFVHVRNDLTVVDVAEGWDHAEWRRVAGGLASAMSWSAPPIPRPGDPVGFAGSPALA